jgi:hypothetical protein
MLKAIVARLILLYTSLLHSLIFMLNLIVLSAMAWITVMISISLYYDLIAEGGPLWQNLVAYAAILEDLLDYVL